MKTKNLLLAGLAVFAMTACNNDIESVDNNDLPLEKNASMQLNFSFPKSSETRATGDKDAGIDFEYGASTVTAILEYSGTNKRLVVKDLEVGEPNADTQIVRASTVAFPVAAGTISKISVIINKPENVEVTEGTDLNKLLASPNAYSLPTEGLDYLRSTIAANSNFLMSGVSTDAVVINAGDKNVSATISVDRVSAKLEEKTNKEKPYFFEFDNAVTSLDDSKISIRIISHTYANLNANSYIFANNGNWFAEDGLLQAYAANKTESEYRWRDAETTYSLENITGVAGDKWDAGKATAALYKGQVYLGEKPLTGHFYVKAKYVGDDVKYILYKDWAEVKKEYSDITIEEGAITPEFLKKKAIKQYSGGVCYYRAPILTNGTKADIVRNNWYQLTVNKINDLGTPTPAPDEKTEEALLTLNVDIMPWTIQANDFTLE